MSSSIIFIISLPVLSALLGPKKWKKLVELKDFDKVWSLLHTNDDHESIPLNAIRAPFFESNIHNLPHLDQSLRNLIVRIYRRIDGFNEHAERYNIYHFKTFDSNISPINIEIIKQNINKAHKDIGVQARIIVNDILKVQKALQKKL